MKKATGFQFSNWQVRGSSCAKRNSRMKKAMGFQTGRSQQYFAAVTVAAAICYIFGGLLRAAAAAAQHSHSKAIRAKSFQYFFPKTIEYSNSPKNIRMNK